MDIKVFNFIEKGILSNLEMWKEYEPFNMTKSVGEFIDKAILS